MKKEEKVMNVKTSRRQPEADQPRNLLGAGVLCLGLDHKNARGSLHIARFAIRRASFQLQDSIRRTRHRDARFRLWAPGPFYTAMGKIHRLPRYAVNVTPQSTSCYSELSRCDRTCRRAPAR